MVIRTRFESDPEQRVSGGDARKQKDCDDKRESHEKILTETSPLVGTKLADGAAVYGNASRQPQRDDHDEDVDDETGEPQLGFIFTKKFSIKTKIEKGTPFKRSTTKSIEQTSKLTEANAESRTKNKNQLHA